MPLQFLFELVTVNDNKNNEIGKNKILDIMMMILKNMMRGV